MKNTCLTKEQCKSKIFKIAIKLGCPPNLIATRLLSEEDKLDMIEGLVPDDAIEAHVRAWMDAGMPDYAHGSDIPYKSAPKKEFRSRQTLEQEQQPLPLSAPFVPYVD